ncbi:hypothetical protein HY990_07035 [Candidatus Micrarchaeota archaeon]|nr:hypothetical protein [Candidatus Micrarchaeota archaeon]
MDQEKNGVKRVKIGELIGELIENNKKLMPIAYALLIIVGLWIVGAPIQSAAAIAFHFIPAYLFLRYILKNNEFASSVLAIPFSMALTTMIFSISMVFSTATYLGWILVTLTWALLFGAGHFFLKNKDEHELKLKIIDDANWKSWLSLFAVIIIAFIGTYFVFYGPINTNKLIWGASDANWQTNHIDYIKESGKLEIPPYLCRGESGYAIESFTPGASMIFPYIVAATGNTNGSTAQQILTYLVYALAAQGVFILFRKIFDEKTALAGVCAFAIPLVYELYLMDRLGMWRLTSFNMMLPYGMLLGMVFLENISSTILTLPVLMFLISNQTFIAFLLIPSFLRGVISTNIKETKNIIRLGVFLLVVGVVFYLTFYQITYAALGQEPDLIKKIGFGLDKIGQNEKDGYVIDNIKLTIEHIGSAVIFFGLISIAYLAHIWKRTDGKNYLDPKFVLLITLTAGIIVASGIGYFGDQIRQYIFKTRYSLLEILILPLIGATIYQIKNINKIVAIALLALVLISATPIASQLNAAQTSAVPQTILQSINYLKQNMKQDETVMYMEPYLGQNIMNHVEHRYMVMDSSTSSIDRLLLQSENLFCRYKRNGLFEVKLDPPQNPAHEPDYVLIYTGLPQLEQLLGIKGYTKVDANENLIIYKKN